MTGTFWKPTEAAVLPAIAGGAPVRSKDRFLVFGRPVIEEGEIAAVVECLKDGWIGTGPRAARLEAAFASYKGGGHAVAVSSGTAALHLALLAVGVTAGSEVVTTPLTHCSVLHAVAHAGATPVLADCDRRTGNLCAREVERRITPKTRAVIAVHLAGRCCDMDALVAVARPRGIAVIEDCAHAVEAVYHGRSSGLVGDVGCFSFYATKNMTTAEGGMLLASDPALAAEARVMARQGIDYDAWDRFSEGGFRHYHPVRVGYKYNLADLNAALGLAQLERLEERAGRREECRRLYDRGLRDLPLVLPAPAEADTRHARHLYSPLLRLEELAVDRDGVVEALRAENIGGGVHFAALHRHRVYQELWGWSEGEYPNAEFFADRTFSLPLDGRLKDEDVEDVCLALRRILLYYSKAR
jgi:dTDP-4-amino-4,6-dideoxygalactose transaminase